MIIIVLLMFEKSIRNEFLEYLKHDLYIYLSNFHELIQDIARFL